MEDSADNLASNGPVEENQQSLTGAARIRANTEKRRQEQLQRDAEIGVEPIDRTPPEKTLESEHSVGDYYKSVSVEDIEAQLPTMQKQADKLALQGASQMSPSGNRSTQKAVAGEGARKLYEQIQNLNGYIEARKNSVVKESLTTENTPKASSEKWVSPAKWNDSDKQQIDELSALTKDEFSQKVYSGEIGLSYNRSDSIPSIEASKHNGNDKEVKERVDKQIDDDYQLIQTFKKMYDAGFKGQPVEKTTENKQVDISPALDLWLKAGTHYDEGTKKWIENNNPPSFDSLNKEITKRTKKIRIFQNRRKGIYARIARRITSRKRI